MENINEENQNNANVYTHGERKFIKLDYKYKWVTLLIYYKIYRITAVANFGCRRFIQRFKLASDFPICVPHFIHQLFVW